MRAASRKAMAVGCLQGSGSEPTQLYYEGKVLHWFGKAAAQRNHLALLTHFGWQDQKVNLAGQAQTLISIPMSLNAPATALQ